MKLLLATSNRGKVNDLAMLLKGLPFELLSLGDFPGLPEVREDGESFLANARKKAWSIYGKTGLPTLADDSGLEVEALSGAPGVTSARYAGEPPDDRRNIEKLLKELEAYPEESQRKARYVCALVFVGREGLERVTCGECGGYIAREPRGAGGFGYDPVFVHPRFGGRTMAEITTGEKNSVSHRGIAFRAMRDELLP